MLTPQILAAALRAAADVLDRAQAGAANGPQVQPQYAQVQPQQQYVQPQQQYVQPQQQYVQPQTTQEVTEEMITGLIQPHISNDAIKSALGDAMRGMGINALPETQPHQRAALYSAFQQVIGRFTGGGLQAAPPPAATSII